MTSIVPQITQAHKQMRESGISFQTKLQKSLKLSDQYQGTVYLKREDQQLTRVFKMRSAFTSLVQLTPEQKAKGVVTISDGNFAQAFAFFCNKFSIQGTIFVPEVCYGWKIELIQKNGKQFVEVKTAGENFDECEVAAKQYLKETGKILIHPSDNMKAIQGCGTIAIEILDDMPGDVDYVFLPVGQGALAAGVASYFKAMSPNTKVIGVQPSGADSMCQAFEQKKVVTMQHFSRFCEGSAVPSVPKLCLDICMDTLDQLVRVDEGKVSTTILQLYNQGIVVEPAGVFLYLKKALSVSVLDQFAHEIKGKNVVCILSGGTVDLSRFDEFKEHSQLHEGLKYFFLIEMPFKSGILKNFVSFCLGPDDDITHIQFQKKANREHGPCLVAIEVAKKESIKQVMENMRKMHLKFKLVNESKELYDLLVTYKICNLTSRRPFEQISRSTIYVNQENILENQLLRKVNLIENHFNDCDSVIVQAEVQQICTDGRLIYSLLNNGDVYQIEQPPKLLVSSRNYKWISPTCAIDHSHRGYVWKTNKQIYSHCKHIATYQDRITVITVGGKIFNVNAGENVPISQLNGLQLNTYFKKALLFAFGGVALTEGGDLYLFNQKMIRVKVKNIEEMIATQKNIFALSGNTILQYSLEELKNHQFFTNQSIFQKMHYCNDVELKCKTKQFQQIQLLSCDYSLQCLAYIKDNKVLDTSLGQCDSRLNSVSTCKQSLFEEWEGRQKKKQAELRKSTEKEVENEEQPTLAQKLATIRESLQFEKPTNTTPQKVESFRKQETVPVRQKSAIQLHKIVIEDFNVDINDSPPPVKLDNLLKKINVIKPLKTIDQVLQGQQELHDSLPTFQNDDQFEQRNTKQQKKQQESSGVESNSGFSQQDSLMEILDNKRLDYPLQLQPFDKRKNQKPKVEILDAKEVKPLQASNRSSRKMENTATDRCSTKRSIDQAKQDLETLVNIITKQKENKEIKKPVKIASAACVQQRPESKVTPLRRSSAEESSQHSIRMPIRVPKSSSKTITQQSLQSINQDSKQFNTLQDCDDLKSAKLLFDQSIQSKKSEQPKGLVRVASQAIGKSIRTNSITSKKTSVMIQKKQINRKLETRLSKVFFRLDVRIKLNQLDFLNSVKLLL